MKGHGVVPDVQYSRGVQTLGETSQMQPVEGGLWIVVYVSIGFAALVAFNQATQIKGNIVQRAAEWLFALLAMTPIMFALFSFLGGLALLAWQSYQYLRFGNWPSWKLAHVVHLLDVRQTTTGWVGVDQIVLVLLDTSAVLALVFVVPASVLVVLGITAWILAGFWKAIH